MQNEEKTYNTAVEVTLEVIGGKWKPVILFHLTFGKKRNGEFMQLIPAISQKVLTQQLGELVRDGIINRIAYNQIPPKVEYELTDYGWSLKEILHAMCRWGDGYMDKKYGDKGKILFKPPVSEEEITE
ncbi:DNA-binding transcriptional regulator, HxlR family [Paenibacillus catalpae]|uniref:DNA-binding transcriptional regulator, HxlR family n=1 Tax=Paenibacillus catalpae TaxID=1045775 RepID=A0A1I2GL30_9BACL|nr:helix-turn-helix domain-containing protein [Paenibacillus catalpae]SFF17446.1 DNA-binding transcriptional regulator, HxlR family [Paenibacillus catalpae]